MLPMTKYSTSYCQGPTLSTGAGCLALAMLSLTGRAYAYPSTTHVRHPRGSPRLNRIVLRTRSAPPLTNDTAMRVRYTTEFALSLFARLWLTHVRSTLHVSFSAHPRTFLVSLHVPRWPRAPPRAGRSDRRPVERRAASAGRACAGAPQCRKLPVAAESCTDLIGPSSRRLAHDRFLAVMAPSAVIGAVLNRWRQRFSADRSGSARARGPAPIELARLWGVPKSFPRLHICLLGKSICALAAIRPPPGSLRASRPRGPRSRDFEKILRALRSIRQLKLTSRRAALARFAAARERG